MTLYQVESTNRHGALTIRRRMTVEAAVDEAIRRMLVLGHRRCIMNPDPTTAILLPAEPAEQPSRPARRAGEAVGV